MIATGVTCDLQDHRNVYDFLYICNVVWFDGEYFITT